MQCPVGVCLVLVMIGGLSCIAEFTELAHATREVILCIDLLRECGITGLTAALERFYCGACCQSP